MLCSPRFCDVGFPVAIDMKKKVRVDLNLHLICRQVLRGKRPALCHVNVEEETEGKNGFENQVVHVKSSVSKANPECGMFWFFFAEG